MILSPRQKQDIGFSYVLTELKCLSPYGEKRLRALAPYPREEKEALLRELADTEKARLLPPSGALRALKGCLKKLREIGGTVGRLKNETLSLVELFELKGFLLTLKSLREAYFAIAPGFTDVKIQDFSAALLLLDPEDTKNPAFAIRTGWSKELAAIRFSKKQTEEALLSAPAEARKALLEKQRALAALEDKEEERIRERLSRELSPFQEELSEQLETLGRLDLLLAKGQLAARLGGVPPRFSDSALAFVDMLNPYYGSLLEKKDLNFTPLSIALGPGVTVLTGANMGGKSVALKTLALNVYLIHCGLLPFAREATLPFFDSLSLISGEGEDGEAGLSSFGGELLRADEAARRTKTGFGLYLFDEFARGTNPYEAEKLQKGLLVFFSRAPGITLLVTHTDSVAALTQNRYRTRGLDRLTENENLSGYASGEDKLRALKKYMDYGLERVTAQEGAPREALRVARLLGLEEGLLEAMREQYIPGDGVDIPS